MRLIAAADRIRRRFGIDPVSDFLFATIRRDSHRVARPIGAIDGERSMLMVRQQELGNAITAGVDVSRIIPYEPYVTFDARLLETRAAASLAHAVAEFAQGRSLRVDGDFPEQHLAAVRAEGVQVADPEPVPDRVEVYEITADEVLARVAAWRRRGAAVVGPIVDAIPHLEGLSAEFTTDIDTRYDALDARLAERSADAVLVSAPPNVTELTGLREQRGCWVLRVGGAQSVFIISKADHFGVSGRPAGRFASLGAAVASLAARSEPQVAVEDQWITAAECVSLRENGVHMVPFSRDLGSWRDLRDREDLPFQILATRISLFAIETALAWAHERLDAGEIVTERQVHLRHVDLIHEYRREHGIPFTVEPYMVNAHSSRRVLYPCLPTDFALAADEECMMLDSGVKVGIDGVVLGTSDMGRTLVRGDRFSHAYDLVRSIVSDDLLPKIGPGVSMQRVHEYAMAGVRRRRSQMESIGMLHPGVDVESAYRRRNVGHLMGKQESFSNEFRPGSHHRLQHGDVGAAELPWIFGEYALTYEDMWYVGRDRVFVTSI